MAAKKKHATAKPEPKADTIRKVAPNLGGGEVRVYNVRRTVLPDLVDHPPEKLLAEADFFLVHFPSRRWVAVEAGRGEALRLAKRLEAGYDEAGLIPRPKPKRVSLTKAAGDEPPEDSPPPPRMKPPENRISFTTIPEDADFDQAMSLAFPPQVVIRHFERLLHAQETVFDRDGNNVGSREAFPTQWQVLSGLSAYLRGRPREQEKKKQERPVLTIEELREKAIRSPEYRQAILDMMQSCADEAAAREKSREAGA